MARKPTNWGWDEDWAESTEMLQRRIRNKELQLRRRAAKRSEIFDVVIIMVLGLIVLGFMIWYAYGVDTMVGIR